MRNAAYKHRDTARAILAVLTRATEDGTFDKLACFIHPDIINQFCDAVSDMAQEEVGEMDNAPTYDELAELLDNVSAIAETLLLQSKRDAEWKHRERIITKARDLSDHLLRSAPGWE